MRLFWFAICLAYQSGCAEDTPSDNRADATDAAFNVDSWNVDVSGDIAMVTDTTDVAALPACGAPVNDAPVVKVETMAMTFSTATGGKVEPGKYHLVRVEVRAGATGTRDFQQTVNIVGSEWRETDRNPAVSAVDNASASQITVAGTAFDLKTSCGLRDDDAWVFSSSGSELLLMDAPSGGTAPLLRFTYRKVP